MHRATTRTIIKPNVPDYNLGAHSTKNATILNAGSDSPYITLIADRSFCHHGYIRVVFH
jgi:hypothetical protein